MSFKPATVWGEGGKRGPSPLSRLILCLDVRPLMVVVKERSELTVETGNVKRLEDFHVTLLAENQKTFGAVTWLFVCLFLAGF